MTEHQDQLNQATQDRLAKLATIPVDMSRLEKKMADALPPKPEVKPVSHQAPAGGWFRIAAMFVLMAGIAGASYFAIFSVGPQSAIAQTMTIAELHEHLLDDPKAAYTASSIDRAQSLIDAQMAGELALPIVDGAHVESCCLVEGQFPLRAALVINDKGSTATIIIAQGENFAHKMDPIDHPSGVELQGHAHAGVPMVMRNVGDLWMCVMGNSDRAELVNIAAELTLK